MPREIVAFFQSYRRAFNALDGAAILALTPGLDGFLPDGSRDWRGALIAPALDPDLRRRVGEAARHRIETAESLAAGLPRYLEILRRPRSA